MTGSKVRHAGATQHWQQVGLALDLRMKTDSRQRPARRAFTEGASVSALDLVGRAPIGGLIQAPKHLTDAGIPPHHNLEEGRCFLIKVRLGTVSSQPSTQDAFVTGAGSVTGTNLNGRRHMITKQQARAEQATHEALDANDADTVHSFAEFAAGEMDTIPVIELLAAIHTMPLTEWETMLGKMHGSMSKCLRDLACALERQRAKFMEAQACANIAAGEAQREDQHRCAHDFNCRGECF